MREHRKILLILVLFILILLLGVIGYSVLLGVGILDALYMTVITLSTVGYKEVAVMTPEAKLFSIVIILFGLSFVGYLFTSIATLLMDGDMRAIVRRRRMRSKMQNLENHYILCGAGETGKNIIRYFENSDAPYVVIDSNELRVRELTEQGIFAIHGNAEDEEVLIEAGIERARGLISSLASDNDNVFTVLTARFLNKDLYIISRAIEEHADEKLTRAGADRTISPNEIEGRRMAALMLRPTVISFLDMITHVGDVVLDLEDVLLGKGSELCGQTLRSARIPEKTGLIVLALQRQETRRMLFNPGSDEKLLAGDSMIVLGTAEKIATLKELAKDTGARECP